MHFIQFTLETKNKFVCIP